MFLLRNSLLKSVWGFFALFFFISVAQAQQPVVSSCTAPDSIRNRYQDDADRLAIRTIYQLQSSDTAQIRIIEPLSDTFLRALLAVYNATSLSASDTVTTMFLSEMDVDSANFMAPGIHTIYYSPALRDLVLTVDPQQPWVQELYQNHLPTGEGTIDSLMSYFHLAYQGTESGPFNTYNIYLKADSNLNIQELARLFREVNGVFNVVVGLSDTHPGEDPNDLEASIDSGYVDLVFRHAWGDCPSGCTSRRFWEFKVYPDCSVEFVKSYGDPFYPSGIGQETVTNAVTVSPNPFTEFVELKGFSTNFSYMLFNAVGQRVSEGKTLNGKINGLSRLANGNYWLRIQNKTGFQLFKLLKQK